jgi:hypothetical protein
VVFLNNRKSNGCNGNILSSNEQYLSGPLLWIGISLGVIFAILYYIPFPLSIPLAIAAFIFMNFHLRKRMIKKINTTMRNHANSSLSYNYYYSCINCGTNHNQVACPKCGSKVKRANFSG